MPFTVNCVTPSTALSTSLSLASTLPVSAVSSGVVPLSGAATGASSTGVIVMRNCAGAETAPASSVTVWVMAVAPL